MTLDELIALFQANYYLPDPAALELSLATIVSTRMKVHQPVWILLVGPPSSGKTAIFDAFVGQPDVRVVSSVTEAGLLSGTTSKDPGATGGVLRALGSRGTLCLKDMTSLLSQPADTRNRVIAAFREIHDGRYVRELGGMGGRRHEWNGKLGVLGGVTEMIEHHLADIGAMGERFLYYRMPIHDDAQRVAMGTRAGRNAHREDDVRSHLVKGVDAFLRGLALPPKAAPLADEELAWLNVLCDLVTRCRTSIPRDWKDRVDLVPEPEATPRMVGMCFSLDAGLQACGIDTGHRRQLLGEVAIGSIPKARRQLLELVTSDERSNWTIVELARRLHLASDSVRRLIEDLTALQVVEAHAPSLDPIRPSEWLRDCWHSAGVGDLVLTLHHPRKRT